MTLSLVLSKSHILITFSIFLFYILLDISIVDLKTNLIPERKLLLLASTGLFYRLILFLYNNGEQQITSLLKIGLFSIYIYILLMMINYLSKKLMRITLIGLGDIKLFAISILWIGVDGITNAFKVTFLISGCLCLFAKLIGRMKQNHRYPFSPFISIGILYEWIFHQIYTYL